MYSFRGGSADEVWTQAVEALRSGQGHAQDSRGGATDELLHSIFSISDPRRRWTTVRNPPMSVAFAVAEVVWIVSGRNDVEFLTFWNTRLPEFSGPAPRLHGAYGYRLRRSLGFDQLERAYSALRSNADSRQVVLQIWDGRLDLPKDDGSPADRDIPCNICSLLKVRSGKLHWTQVLRSNDIYRGVPYNFVQFTFLQEVLAGWLGLDVGDYTHVSDSLHLYENTKQQVLSYRQQSCDHLADDYRLSRQDSCRAFRRLSDGIEMLQQPRLNAVDFEQIANELPPAYANLLFVCGAESARRHKLPDQVLMMRSRCTNSLLLFLLDAWLKRMKFLR